MTIFAFIIATIKDLMHQSIEVYERKNIKWESVKNVQEVEEWKM